MRASRERWIFTKTLTTTIDRATFAGRRVRASHISASSPAIAGDVLPAIAGPSSVAAFASINLSPRNGVRMNVKALVQSAVTVLVVLAIVNRVPQLKAIVGG